MSDNEHDDEVAVEPETTEEVTDVVAEDEVVEVEVEVEEVVVEVEEVVVEVEENAPYEEVIDDDQKQGLTQTIEVDPPKADEPEILENVPKKKKKKRKKKKSKVEEEEDESGFISSAKAWKTIAVKKGSPKYNWYACKINGKVGKCTKLVVEQSGTGGAKECSEYLQQQDSKILFGLILAKSYDNSNSIRSKFIYFRFVGKNVSFMSKAKLTPCMGALDGQFPTKHLTLELSEQCEDMLTPIALSTQLLRIGGAHKPDRYEFGPDQVIDV